MHSSAYFYPRPPRGGRLSVKNGYAIDDDISIHALREEGDLQYPKLDDPELIFLSTPSARRATEQVVEAHRQLPISIHALREEGDSWRLSTVHSSAYFYPRPPRGGRRGKEDGVDVAMEFLSTPSARRATLTTCYFSAGQTNFYPRPPRGGRRILSAPASFRPPFLSTPSARRATSRKHRRNDRQRDFYPRPPRGGRHEDFNNGMPVTVFLSTPSARRATVGGICRTGRALTFLSTPSARRATILYLVVTIESMHFYPRPPRGGRQGGVESVLQGTYFYPRPPRGGRLSLPIAVSLS